MKKIFIILSLIITVISNAQITFPTYQRVGAGEYAILYIDSLNKPGKLYAANTNLAQQGVGGTGSLGVPNLVKQVSGSPMPLFVKAYGGLHDNVAIDTAGYVWHCGAGDLNGVDATDGNPYSTKIFVDINGNPFTPITQCAMFWTNGPSIGWYAIKGGDSTLWWWGWDGGQGFRGDGTATSGHVLKPTQIVMPGSRKVIQIIAGYQAIALCSDGTVWAWGNGTCDLYGNPLGYACSGTDWTSPHQLAIVNAKWIAGGNYFNYAICGNDSVMAWGIQAYLGVNCNGNCNLYTTPQYITPLLGLPSGVKKIVTSSIATHAILNDSTLWGWGNAAEGGVGNGQMLNRDRNSVLPDGTQINYPYNWGWNNVENLIVYAPKKIVPSRSDFINIYGAMPYTRYKYAECVNGQFYFWGRNKTGMGGNGIIPYDSAVGLQSSIFDNAWNDSTAQPVNPFTLRKSIVVPAQPCYLYNNAWNPPCGTWTYPAVTPPTINAGTDQNITTSTTTLTATSSPASGRIVASYVWTQIIGPSTAYFNTFNDSTVSLSRLVNGTYTFRIRATDDKNSAATDDITVAVNASGTNLPPVASAGADQSITLPTSQVTLVGIGTDPDGTISTYAWSQVSGTAATINSTASATTIVSALTTAGSRVFRLTVTDNQGATATSDVTITVNPNTPVSNTETHDFVTYDTTVNLIGGMWNLRITRPVNMFTAGHPDTASRPAIIFMVGAGETIGQPGITIADIAKFGPHYWLNNGWDGSVVLANGTHYPIIISVQPYTTSPTSWSTGALLLHILSTYHIKSNAVHLTGLSMGAIRWEFLLSAEKTIGDRTYMKKITSIAALSGLGNVVGLADWVRGDLPYRDSAIGTTLNPWLGAKLWAKVYNGKLFTLEGLTDPIQPYEYLISQPMNDTVAASAYYHVYHASSNDHCCWNTMYNPTTYQWGGSATNGFLTEAGSQPPTVGTYKAGSSLFQWMLRQGDTSLVGGTNTKKIVVLGSSTAVGTGASAPQYAWVNLLTSYFQTINPNNVVTNLAAGGYTTYYALPTGYTSGPGYAAPDTARNITKAISLRPDAIIVNFPTNDASAGYTLTTTMRNFRIMKHSADSAGIPIWIATTQPKNEPAIYTTLIAEKDSILAEYGDYSINFWNTIANPNGSINSAYNSGDGVHLNDAGHQILYQRAIGSNLFSVIYDSVSNQSPVANAGADQYITLPTTTATLTGSGTDPDGTIASYAWTQVSGTTATITSPTSATTTITGMGTIGTRGFRLTVTDNDGATNSDDVLIVVDSLISGNETHDFVTYDTTVIYGSAQINLRITRPVNMFTPNHQDTASRPAIIFIGGQGEAGTDTSLIAVYGPHYWLRNGWDGGITLGNGKHYPIIITIQPSWTWMGGTDARFILNHILNTYHIKRNSVHLTGLSQGAFAWSSMINTQASADDETGMKMATSLTVLQGIANGLYGNMSASDVPFSQGWEAFGHWAKKYGGKFFGLEGYNDNRSVWLASDNIKDSIANYAYFSYEGLGGGNHCCWNTMYNPSEVNWSSVTPLGTYITTNTYHPNSMGTYVNGDYLFKWMLKQGDTVIVGGNVPPVAIAGDNQGITLPTSTVTLSGSGTDVDGFIVSYSWIQISGTGATITSPTSASTTITGLSTSGIRIFRLIVTDNNGSTGTSDVTITVNAIQTPAPTADAGTNQTVQLPVNSTTLTGSSTNAVSYQWTQASGTAATIASPTSLITDITGLTTAGTRVFRLTATAADGRTATDTAIITVNAAPINSIPGKVEAENYSTRNGAMITVPTSDSCCIQDEIGIENTNYLDYAVVVSTTGTYSILFRTATAASGAQLKVYNGASLLSTVNITNSGGYSTWVNVTATGVSLTAGSQTLRIVSSNAAIFGMNFMVYTLTSSGNQPPSANAGSNQAVLLPITTATLTGSGTPGAGSITTYAWTQISGTTATITSPSSATTTITGLNTIGTYSFRLTVTQTDGQTSTSDVAVVVGQVTNRVRLIGVY